MKKLFTIALAGILSTGTLTALPVQSIYAEENQTLDQKTISNSFEYTIHTNKDEYVKAVNDEHFFDDKKNENPLYNLLKEQIIKIAKGEGELTFTFDLDVSLTKQDINDVLDQIVKDMEPYFYWSNGKGMYSYTEKDSKKSILFTFERIEELFVSKEGIYSDGNGNQLIPYEKIEEENLTLDDLQKICGDSLMVVMDDDGQHILFVGGNFSQQKVTSSEEALQATECMKNLMGLSDNLTLVCSKTSTDPILGYTYYSFTAAQDQGLNKNKIVIVGVDSNGQVSLVTNSPQSVWNAQDCEVTDLEEEKSNLEDEKEFEFLEEAVQEVYYQPLNQYCYELVAKTPSGNYAKVYISKVKSGINDVAVEYYNSLEALKDENEHPYEFYFDEDVQTSTMTFTDYFGNEVELPVAYKEGKGYYLLDKERKMIGTTAGEEDCKGDLLQPYYFSTPDEVNATLVSAFYNLRISLDDYKNKGLFVSDKPKIVNLNTANEEQASAELYSDSIYISIFDSRSGAEFDTISHELTHVVQATVSTDTQNGNANGAMAESYADICGNILEMLAAENHELAINVASKVDLETWSMGETTGNTIRIMGNPNSIYKPTSVYGKYYVLDASKPNFTWNDQGGTHTNCSVLSYIAYRMNKESNLSKEEVLKLFYLTEYLYNINSDYKDVCSYIEFYMNKLGYSDEQISSVKSIFKDANVDAYVVNKSWDSIKTENDTCKLTLTLTNGDTLPENWSLRIMSLYSNQNNYELEKISNTYGYIVAQDSTLVGLYVSPRDDQFSMAALTALNPYTIKENTNLSVNAYDVASALYGNYVNNGFQVLLTSEVEALKEAYQDDMVNTLLKLKNEDENLMLKVVHNTTGDDLGVYYQVKYNTDVQGFDLLLAKDGTYDFILQTLSFDEGYQLIDKAAYKDIAIEEAMDSDHVIDLSKQTPASGELNLTVENEPESDVEQILEETNSSINETVEETDTPVSTIELK